MVQAGKELPRGSATGPLIVERYRQGLMWSGKRKARLDLHYEQRHSRNEEQEDSPYKKKEKSGYSGGGSTGTLKKKKEGKCCLL